MQNTHHDQPEALPSIDSTALENVTGGCAACGGECGKLGGQTGGAGGQGQLGGQTGGDPRK
ncbi:MAG TPA: hypothetical protein VFQ53_32745 [Kofleriaceae bacterium]|nr:hypothetical protein [Kofleriaceae bacterium]